MTILAHDIKKLIVHCIHKKWYGYNKTPKVTRLSFQTKGDNTTKSNHTGSWKIEKVLIFTHFY